MWQFRRVAGTLLSTEMDGKQLAPLCCPACPASPRPLVHVFPSTRVNGHHSEPSAVWGAPLQRRFKVKHFLLFTWDTGTANEGFKEASTGLSQLGDGLGGWLGTGKRCREGLMDLHFPSTLFPWVLRINLFL